MHSVGMKPGENIQDYVKRLEVQAIANEALLKANNKAKFSLSEKGVFVYKHGQGFPISLSPAKAKALRDDKAFWDYVSESLPRAEELRKKYQATEEYKTNSAKLQADRKAYTLSMAK